MKRGILLTASAAGVVLLTAGWLDGGFAKRTQIDIDSFRHPAGKPVLLTIDPGRLEKASGSKFSANTVKLGYEDVSGKEVEVPFATGCLDKVDNKMRLNFVSPGNDGKLYLYFDGKSSVTPKSAYFDVLGANALNAAKYWSNGLLKATQGKGKMTLRLSRLAVKPTDDTYVEQTFPVPPELQGMPVTFLLDAFNHSKAMWPFSVAIVSMDAKRKIIGQPVCDTRWTMMQTVPEKPYHIRQEGKIDPRAKFIRVRLVAVRAGEARNFDVFGKPLADPASSLPHIDITRLMLIPGNIATLPGANPELYTAGVASGTSALKLDGKTSPLYNNFPSTVWGQSHHVRNQDYVFWPIGKEGTAEFYLRFDELPKESTVILDNGRNRNPSFLRLEYAKGKFFLKMNSYGKKDKNWRKPDWDLNKTIPANLEKGKWNHFAITWSQNGVNFYINGKKVMSDPAVITPAEVLLKKNDKNSNIAEYTCFGADAHRFYDDSGTSVSKRYIKGAVDELRVSKVVRYTTDFTPAATFAADDDTCALFSYEKNFDGVSGVGPRYISGSIYTAGVPPRADVFTVEEKNGSKSVVRYVPKEIPDSNMPQYFIRETSYPVLPTPEDFKMARIPKSKTAYLANGDKLELTTPDHTVPEYVEIKAVNEPVKAPFLRHHGEIDARSFADIGRSIDFSDCKNDHEKARKTFDFLVSSTDYFTFAGAEFPRYSNTPMHAGSNGLVAINSYACFQCGPLNGIASGLYVNGLGYPSVLTFGNGHLFQQVQLNGKLRVFDLSAQQYFPSRDQDDAASLDELEKDIYLFQRTRRPTGAVSHFFRMGRRGSHSVANAPRERLEYTLYPGESFRYYPANAGVSNDINVLDWRGKRLGYVADTWTDHQKETGAAVEVARVIQRPQPHTSQGIFFYDGKVSGGAFSNVKSGSFCYRIDSPYTIIKGIYSVPDKNASFELSYDKGKNWRKLDSANGICNVEYALRGRHVALLKVTTSKRDNFKATTWTQMSPRRQTGLVRAGKNALLFSTDGGKAQVTVAYRERAKEISFDGGFFFGVVPGLERQLFTLEPGKSRTITVNGASAKASVKSSGGLKAGFSGGKLTITAPAGIEKGVKYVILTDGNAVKAIDVLVCKGVKEYTVKDFTPAKVRRQRDKLELRKADSGRVQDVVKGCATFDVSGVTPGKYAVFSLTRRDNRIHSVMQTTIHNGKQELVGARTRNPGFEYYKATYGPFPARWVNRTDKENSINPWSRFRWDVATGKDTYPRISNVPLLTEIKAGNKPLHINAHTECAGVILLPAEDRYFMYMTARNLLNMSRADWMFDNVK